MSLNYRTIFFYGATVLAAYYYRDYTWTNYFEPYILPLLFGDAEERILFNKLKYASPLLASDKACKINCSALDFVARRTFIKTKNNEPFLDVQEYISVLNEAANKSSLSKLFMLYQGLEAMSLNHSVIFVDKEDGGSLLEDGIGRTFRKKDLSSNHVYIDIVLVKQSSTQHISDVLIHEITHFSMYSLYGVDGIANPYNTTKAKKKYHKAVCQSYKEVFKIHGLPTFSTCPEGMWEIGKHINNAGMGLEGAIHMLLPFQGSKENFDREFIAYLMGSLLEPALPQIKEAFQPAFRYISKYVAPTVLTAIKLNPLSKSVNAEDMKALSLEFQPHTIHDDNLAGQIAHNTGIDC